MVKHLNGIGVGANRNSGGVTKSLTQKSEDFIMG